jgi:NhaA family Na+:H+ antiporter
MVGRAANCGVFCVTRPSAPETSGPAPSFAARVVSAIERFIHVEAVSGVVLLIAAAAALLWANSPYAQSYHHLWDAPLSIGVGAFSSTQSLHFVINEVLMTIFFLVVGMEIRRELQEGALANVRAAMLPLAAAIGGIAVPAAIYLLVNQAPGLRDGWAVPTATDIAFAVGVLALLGRSIPPSVRIFLLALAILDDIAAVIFIAGFYSAGLDVYGLLIAAAGVALVLALQRIGATSAYAYLVPGAVLWWGLLRSGVHPTLAGVVLGLMSPVLSPAVTRVEAALHPWVAYVIMPLFALANAGVTLDARADDSSATSIMLGVILALVLGKPAGILLGSWAAVRLGWSVLPQGVTWAGVAVAGCLGGIGFTMSIFIATLAFEDAALLAAAKRGVLVASFMAGSIGLLAGYAYTRRARQRASEALRTA